jgi:hypothetical protein
MNFTKDPMSEPLLTLEQLNQRRTQLRETLLRAQGNADAAKAQLQDVKREAKTLYGTDDLDELKRLQLVWQAENEQARRSYQNELQIVAQRLRAMQQQQAIPTAK